MYIIVCKGLCKQGNSRRGDLGSYPNRMKIRLVEFIHVAVYIMFIQGVWFYNIFIFNCTKRLLSEELVVSHSVKFSLFKTLEFRSAEVSIYLVNVEHIPRISFKFNLLYDFPYKH